MKKLLTILFVFAGVSASAQWTPMKQKYQYPGIKITDSLHIPSDTTNNKTGIARIGTTLLVGNGSYWSPISGGGVSGVDSVTIVQTGCAFTFYTWQAGVSTAVGTLSQYNGLTPGTGLVTRVSGTTFNVTAAVYAIDCVTYVTRDTTITLPAAGDTGRIDVIKVNTSGVTTQGTGTEGEALALPSLSATELALTYVLVTDTGVTVSLPTDTALWVSVGTSIRNANTGPVNVRTSLRVGTYSVPVTDAKIHTDGIIHAAGGVSVDPAVNSATLTGIYPNGSNSGKLMSGNNVDATWGINGTTTRSHFGINGGFNTAAGASGLYSALSISSSIQQAGSPGANTRAYAFQDIGTVINQGTSGTGTIWGTYYHPSITALNGSSHIAYENTSGDIVHRNLAGSGTRMVVANDSGLLSTQAIPGGGGTPTWQQSLTAGSIRTSDVISESVGKSFRLYDRSSDSQTATTMINDTSGFVASHIETRGTKDLSVGMSVTGSNATMTFYDAENILIANVEADSTKAEMAAAFVDGGGKNNKIGVAPNLSKGGFYYTSESGQYYFPRNTPTSGDVLTANTGGVLEWVAPASGSTSDTIFVDAPLEAYTSGDSNKIRINPDTLAAWRPKYKVYTALLNQVGTDAPVATVLENTLGGTIVWTRGPTGNYVATLTGAFPSGKTWCMLNSTDDAADVGYYSLKRFDDDTCQLDAFDTSVTPVDDILINTAIEIRVYY